jgi:hypothetical protein
MIRGEVGTRKYQPSGTLGGTGRQESQEKKETIVAREMRE